LVSELFSCWFLPGLNFDREEGICTFFQSVCVHLLECISSYQGIKYSSERNTFNSLIFVRKVLTVPFFFFF
jgi:hypothetical protein